MVPFETEKERAEEVISLVASYTQMIVDLEERLQEKIGDLEKRISILEEQVKPEPLEDEGKK